MTKKNFLTNREPTTQDVKNRMLFRLYAPIVIMALFVTFPSEGRADTPTQVVETLHNELLEVMKDAEMLGFSGRYERLENVVPELYDFPFISRIVVGRHWGNFSEEEKNQFIDLFTTLSIATYADRFDGYSGESFRVLSINEFRGGRIVVESALVQARGEKIQMTYMLHETDDSWKIIDVVVEGISDLALKRADYTAFLNKNTTQAFFDELNTMISEMSD
jgi:phospholipid transport system substrate-binding protein